MSMVDGIMSVATNIATMHMAMTVEGFNDDADGVRMRVRCQHRGGEKRCENHGYDSRKPCKPALMHKRQIAPV